jgi:hypothetical protein
MTATINASTSAGVVTTADTSGILQLQTNGTAALTVDASQNVGIGITSPTRKLAVSGTWTNTGDYLMDSGSPQLAWTSGDLRFKYAGLSGTEAMRITSVGNVGINTTSPARTLHVKGGGVTTLANSNGALFTDASNAGVLLGSDNAIGYISGVTVAGNATASLVLQPFGGNLFLNTTSQFTTGGFNPIVTINSTTDGIAIPNIGSGYIGYITRASGSHSYYAAYFLNSSNSTVGSINCTTSATSYVTSSDYRLKEDIQPMTGALDKVALLKPVTYKWKATGETAQGFVAHELQAVVPECVVGEKDAVDADGNPEYQGIDTSFLVATLTAAIQELKAIVDAQGAEIAALKGATA